MIIRKAVIRDLIQLAKIKIGSPELNDFPGDINNYYIHLIEQGIAIVIEINNQIVAFMVGEKEEEFSHSFVEDLWINKQYRNKGYCKLLLAAYEKECSKFNIKYLTTYVNENNKRALNVVTKTGGFLQKDRYYFMEKTLN